MKWIIPAIVIAIAVASFPALVSVGRADDRVAQGATIYADKCASCHAKDGSGNVPRGKAMKAPDLRATDLQKKTDAQLTKGILDAKRHPSFQKINNDDMAKLMAFLRTLKR